MKYESQLGRSCIYSDYGGFGLASTLECFKSKEIVGRISSACPGFWCSIKWLESRAEPVALETGKVLQIELILR